MKKMIRLCVLALAIVFIGNMAMGDFYVIPTVKKMFAPVAKTGQISSYAVWDDAYLQKGVAWPNPRFTDNGNGTVTDNLTGLVWMQNAKCGDVTRTWNIAVAFCALLSDPACGLSDGSSPGDWRLPNVRELQSLIHYGRTSPAVPNTAGTDRWTEGEPFSNVQSSLYWSSSTYMGSSLNKWDVGFLNGSVSYHHIDDEEYAWCVRDAK